MPCSLLSMRPYGAVLRLHSPRAQCKQRRRNECAERGPGLAEGLELCQEKVLERYLRLACPFILGFQLELWGKLAGLVVPSIVRHEDGFPEVFLPWLPLPACYLGCWEKMTELHFPIPSNSVFFLASLGDPTYSFEVCRADIEGWHS